MGNGTLLAVDEFLASNVQEIAFGVPSEAWRQVEPEMTQDVLSIVVDVIKNGHSLAKACYWEAARVFGMAKKSAKVFNTASFDITELLKQETENFCMDDNGALLVR